MKQKLAILSLLLTVACGQSTKSSALADNATTAGAAATAESGVTQVVDTEAGKVLADLQGLSLYTFDRDTTADSSCYNACATAWPPLLTTLTTVAAPYSLTTRTDGTKQVDLN